MGQVIISFDTGNLLSAQLSCTAVHTIIVSQS